MAIHGRDTLDRQSAPFYANSAQIGEDEPDFYVSMLEQDVQLGLMPIGGRVRKTGQPCARLLSGEQEAPSELQNLIAAAMATDRDSLSSAVSERANQTAAVAVAYGRATYEVGYYRLGAMPVGFVLLYLDPRLVAEDGGTFVQRIPRGTVLPGDTIQDAPRELQEDELRVLDADRVLMVGWPPTYQKGPKWIRQLAWLGQEQFPSFLIENLTQPEKSRVPYDFEVVREAQDRAVASSTSAIGWNARGSFDRLQTSYYFCLRELRFHRFKIMFRDHIVSCLNDAIARAG